MEGGAMRGMFTAGCIDVLMEEGIEFDGAVGVSAGATFGINYKSRQIGRAIRYNKKYINDKRYCSKRNLLKTGDLFDVKFCYDTLPYKLDIFDTDAFVKNPMDFYVTVTNVETGLPEYHKCIDGKTHDLLWIRASASIPMLARIVEIDGHKYLDGGIADSIPVQFMEQKGYNRNVAILTRPLGYKRPSGEFSNYARVLLRKYPNMIKAMQDRAIMYNGELKYIAEQEAVGNLFVIRPPKSLVIPNLTKDPEVLQNAYDVGRQTMIEHLEELKEYLNK